MDEKYLEERKIIESFFIPENKIPGSCMIDVSLSGNFQLEIQKYSTDPKDWNYSRGMVTKLNTGELVADIKRNFGHFWHTWIDHPNGSEYLLCGEDYQGYSTINLTTGSHHTYFPESGHIGAGFCWAAVYPSPDNLVLAVDGCYWACPYDLVLYDFRNPEELPYQELTRIEALNNCIGWLDNETFAIEREVEFRKSDGAFYEKLTEAEQKILDEDSSLVEYRSISVHCKRPNIKNNDT